MRPTAWHYAFIVPYAGRPFFNSLIVGATRFVLYSLEKLLALRDILNPMDVEESQMRIGGVLRCLFLTSV